MIAKISPLDLSGMISVNEQGYPYAPNVYQIQDKDVRELYLRDNSEDKLRYIKEAGVIFYVADPKSPPNQMGYSRSEALASAKTIISEQLTNKLNSGLQAEDALPVIDLVTKLNGIINIIPNQIKALGEAKQAAALEIEQKKARGGKVVTMSMSAKDASDLETQVEAQKRELGLVSDTIVNAPLRGKYESTK